MLSFCWWETFLKFPQKITKNKKSLKLQFLLLRGTITCYWGRTVDGGGEGAVAFCEDFLPPCGSIRLPVKNGQLKFHNCHNERYIVNCSPCLTYCSGTGTDINIYLPPVAKQQEARLWKTWRNLNKVRKCHANVGNITKILPSERYWISMNTITSTGFLTTDCSFFLVFLLNEHANLTRVSKRSLRGEGCAW